MKVRMRLISAILLTAVLFCTGCSVDVNSTASGAKKEEGTAEKKEEASIKKTLLYSLERMQQNLLIRDYSINI